ncbi:hypothetical protein IMX26_16160 [Clostridium sp. 'deep sea']|uniref:hypothetical protein n=1 Tax=Clostridium sp. 'deep sea' TaxID=2779445 RepID=UPI001896547A|nr:hypothetical protein [Clostridium sp. 'deep sea']QOR34973.1 hypothetical protein IMX26_16160 [Clostridium sp. 'deep sea']
MKFKQVLACIFTFLLMFSVAGCTSQAEYLEMTMNLVENNPSELPQLFENLNSKTVDEFKLKIDEQVQVFLDKGSYQEAIDLLEKLTRVDELKDYINLNNIIINSIKESNEYFIKGQEYYSQIADVKELAKKQLVIDNAIENFNKVLIDDKLNYNNAQDIMAELIPQFNSVVSQRYVKRAKELYDSKEYKLAVEGLNEALKFKQSKEIKELKEQYLAKLAEHIESNIVSNYDEMSNITWHYAKNTSKTIDYFTFYTYVGERDSKYWLCLTTGFSISDWVFFNKIDVKADEERFTITFDYFEDKVEEVSLSGVQEWISITDPCYDNLKKIANAKEVKFRFSGDDYYKDFKLSSSQQKKLNQVLDYYKLKIKD